jgi:hypothetical protein
MLYWAANPQPAAPTEALIQQADITAITRDLAGRSGLLFPRPRRGPHRRLEGELIDGRLLARTRNRWPLTQDLQSLNGDKHLRLLHSPAELPERDDEAAERAALADWAERTAGGIARAERLDGNVGYLDLQPLLFPPSIAGEAVAAAMTLTPGRCPPHRPAPCLGGIGWAMVCNTCSGRRNPSSRSINAAMDTARPRSAILDHAVRRRRGSAR